MTDNSSLKEDNLQKIKVIVGINGSGKTHFLNKKQRELSNKELKNNVLGMLNGEILEKEFSSTQKPKTELGKFQEYAKTKNQNYFDKLKKSIQNTETDFQEENEEYIYENSDLKAFGIGISTKSKKLDIIHNSDLHIKLNEKSVESDNTPSGVKNIINLIVTCFKEIKENDKKNTYILLDEFDNFLHPYWIKITCELLKKIVQSDSIKEIYISTHNPYTLECLKYCDIGHINDYKENEDPQYLSYFTKNNLSDDTIQKFFKECVELNIKDPKTSSLITKKLDQNFKDLRDRIDYEYANLFFQNDKSIDKIIICEGITDKLWIEKSLKKENDNLEVIKMYGKWNIFWVFLILKIISFPLNKVILVIDCDKNILKNHEEAWKETIESFFLGEKNEDNLKIVIFDKDLEHALKKITDPSEKHVKLNPHQKWQYFYDNSENCEELSFIYKKIFACK